MKMKVKMSKAEEAAFYAAGEPREEPSYAPEQTRLEQVLTEDQKWLLLALLTAFAKLVQYERRWYFHKGWLAAKREARK